MNFGTLFAGTAFSNADTVERVTVTQFLQLFEEQFDSNIQKLKECIECELAKLNVPVSITFAETCTNRERKVTCIVVSTRPDGMREHSRTSVSSSTCSWSEIAAFALMRGIEQVRAKYL